MKVCKKHRPRVDPVTSDYVCTKCHCIYDITFIHKDQSKVKNLDILIWNREYDKTRWIWNGLEYLDGKFNDHLTDLLWMELCEEIPNPCYWYDVYKVFHKYRLTDYWTCFPSFVGLPITLNKTIMYHVLQYADLGYTKYRISYLYLIYKFTQLFGENACRIPIKGSKAWIKKTDEWWKKICEEHGWQFIPSHRESISWDKDMIVSGLKEIYNNL